MIMGLGDTTFGIPTSAATLQDCETSWNPLVGAQCILSGQILQQVTSSVGVTPPGIFPVSTGVDASTGDAVTPSSFSSILWGAAAIIGLVLVVKVMK